IDHVLEKRRQRSKRSLVDVLQFIFIEKKVFLFIVALLLGRAVILYNISPFALAFLATVWSTHQKRMFVVAALIFFGALTYSVEQAVFIMLSTTIFYLFTRFLKDRSNLRFIMLFFFFFLIFLCVFLLLFSNQIFTVVWCKFFC